LLQYAPVDATAKDAFDNGFVNDDKAGVVFDNPEIFFDERKILFLFPAKQFLAYGIIAKEYDFLFDGMRCERRLDGRSVFDISAQDLGGVFQAGVGRDRFGFRQAKCVHFGKTVLAVAVDPFCRLQQ
jgi:hypothetical protein